MNCIILGTIWTDFKPQIENLNADKLVIVAWDPPGYGKSRPPDRVFSDDFFQRDAAWANNLMKTLGYKKFSLIGWSDGGITSLLLAATYPESVYKMVVLGANAYIHPTEIKLYESMIRFNFRNQSTVQSHNDTIKNRFRNFYSLTEYNQLKIILKFIHTYLTRKNFGTNIVRTIKITKICSKC